MASAWDILLEYMAIGTFTRPDSSGNRMGGTAQQQIPRANNYPYDEDDPDRMYGNPADYGRSGGGEAGHANITPKDIRHTEWGKKEMQDEAMGTPINFGMSGQGQMGSNVPGTVGHGWSDPPIKPWDDDSEDPSNPFKMVRQDDRNDEAYGPMGMHPGVHDVMPPDEIPHNDLPIKKVFLGIVDPEEIVELELPESSEENGGLHTPEEIGASAYGLPTQIRMFAGDPFTAGPGGKSMRHSRYTDLGPSWSTKGESVWKILSRILG